MKQILPTDQRIRRKCCVTININAVIVNGANEITVFTVVIRMRLNALLFMWFSSTFSLPLSPGPDCLRALRTATQQNIWMERKSRNCIERNHIYIYSVRNYSCRLNKNQEWLSRPQSNRSLYIWEVCISENLQDEPLPGNAQHRSDTETEDDQWRQILT